MSWPWNELGLSGPAGLPEIRRAYAQRLKTTHPEEDPEGFQRLHSAYQEASRRARQTARSAPAEKPPPRRAPQEGGAEAELRQGPKGPAEGGGRPAPSGPARKTDWDFNELLEETKEPQKPPKDTGPSQKTDWDFEELLEETEEPQKRPKAASSPEADQDGESPPKEPEEAPSSKEERTSDWDFERLFAEGEAEAQAARRRKLEELREKNRARYAKQEQAQRRRAADEEEAWAAVMAAAHALELLYANGAPLFQWKRFLDSPVFLNVRANIDFVFALEDFLEQHPDLSRDVRQAIFAVYESYNSSKYPIYNRLYRLLNVSQKDKWRMARQKSGWRARWRSFPPWRRATLIVCGILLGLCVLVIWYCSAVSDYEAPEKEPEIPWPEQAPQWLEADYGEPFIHVASTDVFAPASNPDLHFWALRSSSRTAHWRGYRTNYPYVRIQQALEAFAEEREIPLEPKGYTGHPGDAPRAYLFDLPLQGAEEDLAALGEEIARLAAEPWHQPYAAFYRNGESVEAVGYTVFLCHKGLAFHEAYAPKGFDLEEIQSLYAQAGPAFCRYILENSGLADQHLGAGTYALQDQGTVQIGEESFFQVSGADLATGQVRAQYLFSGGMLFCLPQEKWEEVHAVIDLYRGSIQHLQMDKLGLVIVMDQMPEG